jgi:hypothetical protein
MVGISDVHSRATPGTGTRKMSDGMHEKRLNAKWRRKGGWSRGVWGAGAAHHRGWGPWSLDSEEAHGTGNRGCQGFRVTELAWDQAVPNGLCAASLMMGWIPSHSESLTPEDPLAEVGSPTEAGWIWQTRSAHRVGAWGGFQPSRVVCGRSAALFRRTLFAGNKETFVRNKRICSRAAPPGSAITGHHGPSVS